MKLHTHFLRRIFPLGLAAMLAGILPMIARGIHGVSLWAFLSNAAFFVILVIYAVLLRKAQREYLER